MEAERERRRDNSVNASVLISFMDRVDFSSFSCFTGTAISDWNILLVSVLGQSPERGTNGTQVLLLQRNPHRTTTTTETAPLRWPDATHEALHIRRRPRSFTTRVHIYTIIESAQSLKKLCRTHAAYEGVVHARHLCWTICLPYKYV